jgi:plasmid stabilization system protein ParE
VIVRWSRRAASQLFKAADELEGKRPGTGERIYEAVERLVAIVREQPRAFARDPHETREEVRRALVDRFGYWIVYRVEEDVVEGWRRSR